MLSLTSASHSSTFKQQSRSKTDFAQSPNKWAIATRAPEDKSSFPFYYRESAPIFWQRIKATPLEIRERVSSYIFDTTSVHKQRVTSTRTLKNPARGLMLQLQMPPICYVNWQLFSESVPILLSSNDTGIGIKGLATVKSLINFLEKIPDRRAFRSVRHVRIHCEYSFDKFNPIRRLLEACTRLRSLHLQFRTLAYIEYNPCSAATFNVSTSWATATR